METSGVSPGTLSDLLHLLPSLTGVSVVAPEGTTTSAGGFFARDATLALGVGLALAAVATFLLELGGAWNSSAPHQLPQTMISIQPRC